LFLLVFYSNLRWRAKQQETGMTGAFKTAALVIGLGILTASSSFAAQPSDRGNTPGLGWGKGGRNVVGVPGPIAGVGLPLAVAAGLYIWRRSRRQDG
jgi:hypothetical protein